MKLEDIPAIRQQFSDISDDLVKSCADIKKRADMAKRLKNASMLDKLNSELDTVARNHDIQMEELKEKVFGDQYIGDPFQVLDWIEHFLKA